MPAARRTLGTDAVLYHALEKAKEMGFSEARGDSKVNARGEIVLAVIIPPRRPGEWTDERPTNWRALRKETDRQRS